MHIGLTGASGFLGRRILDNALRDTRSSSLRAIRCAGFLKVDAALLDKDPIHGLRSVDPPAGGADRGAGHRRKRDASIQSQCSGRGGWPSHAAAVKKPEVLVCGSAIGFYGERGEEELTEELPPGTGFLAETVQAWEAEAHRAAEVRVVCLRTALVLGREAGALPVMAMPFASAR